MAASPRARSSRRDFGAVERLPSARYRARFRGPDGAWVSAPTTFVTRGEAAIWLDTVHTDLVRKTYRAPRQSRENLAAYAGRWVEQRHELKASSRAHYRSDLRLYIEPFLGRLGLDDITPDLVRDWRAHLLRDVGERLGAQQRTSQATRRDGTATVEKAYRLLRAVMSTALDDGLIAQNPCRVRGGGRTHNTDERPILTMAEVHNLAGALPQHYRALAYLLSLTAIRIGEAAALKVSDLNLDSQAPSVAIRRRVYRVDGQWDIDEPKTAAGRRIVELPSFVAEQLRDHLGRAAGPAEPGAWVFTTSRGGLVLSSYGKTFRRALNQIGRPDVRVHDERHTGQTLAALAGATEAELRRRMGHATSSASRIYSHTTTEHGRAVADAISESARTLAPPGLTVGG